MVSDTIPGASSLSRLVESILKLWEYLIVSLFLLLIAGVLDQVQEFYDIKNAQAGLLQTSFIVSYMFLSPVFGYLGDRYNRKNIMAGGILFWSVITLAGSFIPREVRWIECNTIFTIALVSYQTMYITGECYKLVQFSMYILICSSSLLCINDVENMLAYKYAYVHCTVYFKLYINVLFLVNISFVHESV